MKIYEKNGSRYRLPGQLTPFQLRMYMHLVDWKRANVPEADESTVPYDTFLPAHLQALSRAPHIYAPVRGALERHLQRNPFRVHPRFFHLASSQAAAINLFLPILEHPRGAEVLRRIRPDFHALASDREGGFWFEFWGEENPQQVAIGANSGVLADKTVSAGTDADVAIAYYDARGVLKLWLIEHKLTEVEFTACGAAISKGRNPERHSCERPFSEIVSEPHACYYHDVKRFRYWSLTSSFQEAFPGLSSAPVCPFKGGLNQLWRNQLLALALQERGPYEKVDFSVVRHAGNDSLASTLGSFAQATARRESAFVHSSSEFVNAARELGDGILDAWASWYKDLYAV